MGSDSTKLNARELGDTAIIKFPDGTKVKKEREVKYLGCNLNYKTDPTKEIDSRISTTMAVLQKLHLFWRHSDCPNKFKPQASY